MVDDKQVRDAALRLRGLMVSLDARKHTPPRPPTSSLPRRSTPGPQAPGDGDALSLYAEIERELSRWLVALSPGRHGAVAQLDWVAFNSQRVSEEPDCEAFVDELRRWSSQCERLLGLGPSVAEVAESDPWLSARTIRIRLERVGIRVSSEEIRLAARHNPQITKITLRGKPAYRFGEVCEYFSKKG